MLKLRRSLASLGIASLGALSLVMISVTPAAAATVTYNVTTPMDLAYPSAAACVPDAPQVGLPCSLRAAIQQANLASSATTTQINVPAGTYPITILPSCTNDGDACGDFNVSSTVILTGAGQASTFIDGSSLDRVFRVEAAGNLTMSGVTVQNGTSSSNPACDAGGGIFVLGNLSLSASTIMNNRGGLNGGGIAAGATTQSISTLDHVTIKGNRSQQGAGASQTGCGVAHGTLNINNSVVTENVATIYTAGVDEDGGGTVNITNSTISKNAATGGQNGIVAEVGGVAEDGGGTVTITGSTIDSNSSDSYGGGVVEDGGGTLTITRSIVSDNTAKDAAAGIYLDNATAQISLDHVEVFGNSALGTAPVTFRPIFLGGGGGIAKDANGLTTMNDVYVHDNRASHGAGMLFDGAGTTNMTNVTVSNNQTALLRNQGGVEDGFGGGILVDGTQVLTMSNSTISGNSSASQGGGIMWLNGVSTNSSSLGFATVADNTAVAGGQNLQLLNSAVVNLRATLVSGAGTSCGGGTPPVSQGFNLDSGTSCQLGQPGDQSGVNPLLVPLTNNGGFEPTRALSAGSPAIDAVASGCPPPTTDQRGITRPMGSRCDVGAFEFVPPPAPTPSPTPVPPPSPAQAQVLAPTPVPGLPKTGGRPVDPAAAIRTVLALGSLLTALVLAVGLRGPRRA